MRGGGIRKGARERRAAALRGVWKGRGIGAGDAACGRALRLRQAGGSSQCAPRGGGRRREARNRIVAPACKGGSHMETRILEDAGAVAREAARFLIDEARRAIAARGRFSLALSGGSTPWRMLGCLAPGDLDWERVEVFQVDERVAPAGSEERNLTHIEAGLARRVPLPARQVHAMPVDAADLDGAARAYAARLRAVTGEPARLDLVHLGLGADGHTASLLYFVFPNGRAGGTRWFVPRRSRAA